MTDVEAHAAAELIAEGGGRVTLDGWVEKSGCPCFAERITERCREIALGQ
ncbi:hypothetical protein F9C11_09850 [Amycolatopsis sp. VS8301801F10]